jgi:acyl-CoA reductase-like NAD-dependent aldehyde dehydrogenase
VVRVRDIEEAVRLANDSEYGLGASVFTRERAKGRAIAERLRAGGVCVNDCLANAFIAEAPMGGMKCSGLGRRHAAEGIRKFCEQQTIVLDRLGLRAEPFWFPFGGTRLKLLQYGERLLYGRWLRRSRS